MKPVGVDVVLMILCAGSHDSIFEELVTMVGWSDGCGSSCIAIDLIVLGQRSQ